MKRISKETRELLSAQDVGFGTFTEWKKPQGGEGYYPVTDTTRDLIQSARACWDSLADFRRARARNVRYYVGRQWDDLIHTSEGIMTEEEYISKQGRTPLKQNLIRAAIKTMIGQFRRGSQKCLVIARNKQDQAASEMMSVALEAALDNNDMPERDAALFEEFLISGSAICYNSYGYDVDLQQDIPMYREVDTRKFFKNPNSHDIMGKDVDFIGDFFDTTIDDLKSMYAKNPAQAEALEKIYNVQGRRWFTYVTGQQHAMDADDVAFEFPSRPEQCRVYRIHRLEGKFELYCHDYYDGTQTIMPYTQKNVDDVAKENANRVRIGKELGKEIALIVAKRRFVRRWVYYHIAPGGQLLFMKECPYEHKSHPYSYKFHPIKDGYTWSFVYDFLDQQRMINRMIILNDFLASAQAKGVLLVPDECLGDDIRLEDIADQWAVFNGVIKFHAKPGVPLPQQIVNSQLNTTSMELLKVEMQMMEEISGMHEALQGKRAPAGTPSGLYAQEADNASTNILDFLAAFSSFQSQRDMKLLQIIQQYYTSPMYIALAGRDYEEESHNFDPEKIKGMSFTVKIVKTSDVATVRQYQDTLLNGLMEKGLISLEMYLENLSAPFAQKMLAKIQMAKEQLAQGQQVDPALLQQMQGAIPQQPMGTGPVSQGDMGKLAGMLQREAQPQVPDQVNLPPAEPGQNLPQDLPIYNIQ